MAPAFVFPALEENGELVATEAEDAGAIGTGVEELGELEEDLVTRTGAHRVVDLLEVVDVQEAEAELRVGRRGLLESGTETELVRAVVPEPGQAVRVRVARRAAGREG